MSDEGTFRQVTESDERMYGPRRVLVCGHTAEEQDRLARLLAEHGDPGMVVAHEEDLDTTVGELVSREAGHGQGRDSTIPRLVLLSGVTQRELYSIIGAYKETGMPRPLWAGLTPTSEKWKLRDLLSELQAEQAALEKGDSGDSR